MTTGSARPVDVLVLGADSRFWTPRRQRRLGRLMIAAAVLLVVVGNIGWWRQTLDPTLTHAQVESVYRLRHAPTTGARWDPSSVSTRSDGTDIVLPVTQPAVCAYLMVPDRAPASLDNVQAGLTPVLEERLWSGSTVTYRYADSATAREKLTQLENAVRACATFTFGATRFRVDRVSFGTATHARTDFAFSVSSSDAQGSTRLELMRFGNTVSWITAADDRETSIVRSGTVSDALADGFRAAR